jgi:hypothetical protein
MLTDDQEPVLWDVIIAGTLTAGVAWLLGKSVELGSRQIASAPPVLSPGEDPGEPFTDGEVSEMRPYMPPP